ncbi:uncharacterized protein [Onthophagus taurus]|uniref:uncharacterized protein isoform X2 n=1 Tax=Onthophagus taurus TaxID=166361 RepID=UPI0039BECC13
MEGPDPLCGTRGAAGSGANGGANGGVNGGANGGASAAPAPLPAGYCGAKGGPEQGRFLRLIIRVREPVADYLEKHGLPKNARCSFISLLTSLIQRAYAAGVTILLMLYNLFPLLDGGVYLLRFILDKLLEICQTRDIAEKILKGILFLGELVVLTLLVMFIFGLIVMPVLSLASYILHKFIGIATSGGG